MKKMVTISIRVLLLVVAATANENIFSLNILHYNDFHTRFMETNPSGGTCNPAVARCVGGFARLATAVREAFVREPHSLLLNGGDSFQGTIWYSLLRWNVTQDFMNMLPHDAHVLGNHEFDNGIEGVVPYLEHLNSPMLSANIIDDKEPTIQGLYKPSIVVERKGRKIGIIGVILQTTNEMASTGQLQFTDAIAAVRREAEKLHAQGVNIIIALTHCGIQIEREIALHGGPHIDIIVGGHTHTLLYNGIPPGINILPRGPYPTIVQQGNKKVLIVQAGSYGLFLGELKTYFDEAGNLLSWEGNPRLLNSRVAQAPDVMEKINEYLPIVQEMATREIGYSKVHLSSNCFCNECNLGNLICDAFLASARNMTRANGKQGAHFCVINRGSIRADIKSGVITFESLLVAQPFENNVEVFELRGDHIKEMFEHGVANIPSNGIRMLQVAGIRPVLDGSRPRFDRVVGITVSCDDCDEPRYEPLDPKKYYTMVTNNFVGTGGDGFTMISNNRRNIEVAGIDYDIIMNYLRQHSPINPQVDGRISITHACRD